MSAAKKTPVGARYGLGGWLAQRGSAVVLLFVPLALALAVWGAQPQGAEEWRALLARPAMRLALLALAVALVWHAFLGMRDVLMDYIKPDFLRLVAVGGFFAYLLVCLLWAMLILL